MAARAFIFAGGGTGGHLYPGIAIAEELVTQGGANVHVRFLTSARAIDATVMSGTPFAWEALPALPPRARPAGMVRFALAWRASVARTRRLIRELRARGGEGGAGRDSVTLVAMGGFVAAPAVWAARRERARVCLVNLDATPGKANRWMAALAVKAGRGRPGGVAFTQMPVESDFARSWRLVPPIIRAGARPPGDARACRRLLGLDPDRPVLMVTGGSQGAGSVNQAVALLVERHGAPLRAHGWQVLHQCGGKDEGVLKEAYARTGVPARVESFVQGMGTWWGAADLAISRAGAGSVAEAWSARVPSVFLPYPYHRDQHQKANAQRLVSAGGARVVTDAIEAEATVRGLEPVVAPLLENAEARASMRAALEGLGPADGAARVAAGLLEL